MPGYDLRIVTENSKGNPAVTDIYICTGETLYDTINQAIDTFNIFKFSLQPNQRGQKVKDFRIIPRQNSNLSD
ncbi:MAG: hypothetical protein RR609_06690 [Aurantimicrobium sp.]